MALPDYNSAPTSGGDSVKLPNIYAQNSKIMSLEKGENKFGKDIDWIIEFEMTAKDGSIYGKKCFLNGKFNAPDHKNPWGSCRKIASFLKLIGVPDKAINSLDDNKDSDEFFSKVQKEAVGTELTIITYLKKNGYKGVYTTFDKPNSFTALKKVFKTKWDQYNSNTEAGHPKDFAGFNNEWLTEEGKSKQSDVPTEPWGAGEAENSPVAQTAGW